MSQTITFQEYQRLQAVEQEAYRRQSHVRMAWWPPLNWPAGRVFVHQLNGGALDGQFIVLPFPDMAFVAHPEEGEPLIYIPEESTYGRARYQLSDKFEVTENGLKLKETDA